jgi:hypothetical protein
MSEVTPPESMNPPSTRSRSEYLHTEDVQALARMLNALLTEHWVVCDRLAVMERLLIERGVLESGQVDGYVPSAEFAASLETLRNTVFAKVLDAPFSNDRRTVEHLKSLKP